MSQAVQGEDLDLAAFEEEYRKLVEETHVVFLIMLCWLLCYHIL